MVVARGTCLCFSGRACVGSRHLCPISTLVLITTLSVGKDAGGEREREREDVNTVEHRIQTVCSFHSAYTVP